MSGVTHLDVESFFDKINKHVGLKYAFAGIGLGSNAFLVNLKNKATLTFVEKALERALGSQYSAEAVATSTGQKFVPGERQNEGRCKTTIELEAAAASAAASHIGDSPARIFVLVGVSQRATYSYNTQAGLVKVGKNEERTACPLENGNPVPAGEQAGVASGLVAPHHQGRTADVVGAAAPAPATTRPGQESEHQLKVTVHEALELERWDFLYDTTSTPLQSVPVLAPIMNRNWEEARAKRDGKEAHQIQKTAAGGEFSALKSFVDQGSQNVMETERLSPQVQFDTITAVRQTLSTGHDPSFHVPKLVEFVENEGDPALQLESVRLLATISGSHTHAVVIHGAVPIFVRLLTNPNDDVREEVVRAVGHIAGYSSLSGDMVLQRGALGTLLQHLLQQLTDRSSLSMQRVATWALSKFYVGNSLPRLEQVSPALPTLTWLIHSVDEEVLTNSCAALGCLCTPRLGTSLYPRVNREMVQAVAGAEVCQRLVELLDHTSPAVQMQALFAINGIVSSEDQHTRIVASVIRIATEVGGLEDVRKWVPLLLNLLENDGAQVIFEVDPDSDAWRRLRHLLSSSNTEVRENTCQVIRRITLGNKEQTRAMIEAGIVPALIQLLSDLNPDTRRYVASVSNATEVGEPEEVGRWVPLLLDLLQNDDTQLLVKVLTILEIILQVVRDSDAWQPLRRLLSSPNTKVRDRTCQVIHRITLGSKEQTRAMVEAGIVPVLIQLLADVNYDIRSHAASAISNATKLGESEEVRRRIPLLLSLLEHIYFYEVMVDVLEIIEEILERGDTDAKAQGQEMNQMATCMAECGGWKHLECLERFGLSESVDGLGFFDISPKVRRNLTRLLFVYAMYLMFNLIFFSLNLIC
ncbi:Importin alpha-1 subunit (Karyopherin alpha-1 subunit) (KAP alpha) [Ectocarpus siliculosus]|uniref:Importin alpha-1 subunit (Karyopherin alpha-1 subunit) (KAP alpha) n=1 Tax=Ectocarpus siliculosus TaxID=2880 RepID=D7FJT7_ECTSI|nr:Importin alpha-1 subunit (Karyopherin alpha-1 subunit) (KAP alpha) [Ectocarpus siliculosus]|eukprot:CBJ29189.1 Importin alpha-1 subunit (Karyopherin alpha-1 subunit) (KAP alpha) [Ectocarpus siliculosus]